MLTSQFMVQNAEELQEVMNGFNIPDSDVEDIRFPAVVCIIGRENGYRATIINRSVLASYIRVLEDMWD